MRASRKSEKRKKEKEKKRVNTVRERGRVRVGAGDVAKPVLFQADLLAGCRLLQRACKQGREKK